MKRALIALLFFLFGSVPVVAQTLDEEMAIFAAWSNGSAQIINRMYEIPAYSEKAAEVYQDFVAELTDEDTAIADLAVLRAEMEKLVLSLKSEVENYPAQPKLKYFEQNSALFEREKFVGMLEELRGLGADSIDSFEKLVQGEAFDPEAEFLNTLEKVRLFGKMSDSILAGQRQSIQFRNHPQRFVIDAMMNSNRAILLSQEYLGVLENYDVPATADELIADFKDVIKKHRRFIAKGKKGQSALTKQYEPYLKTASAGERATVSKVLNMMKAYDDAWALEENFINSIDSFVTLVSSGEAGYATVQPALDTFSAELITFEMQRLQLAQDRVSLLQ